MTTHETPPDISLRERKKLETRRMIRRVALDLAMEHGLEELTVEAIAQAAEISPRTFFNYFSHKEDALVTDAAAAASALHPAIVARPAEESPLHAIRAVITEHDLFSLMNTDRDRTLARQKLVQQHPTLTSRQLGQHALMEQALRDAVAERLGTDPESDLRPALVAGVAGSVMRIAIQRWTASDDTKLSDLLVSAFDMLEQGLLSHAPVDASASDAASQAGGNPHE
ncbi:acyl-CoA-like ligand-binding transcription factor [Brevibacterium yomogidense]|uniref:Transcriptional regulator, TetR family n=1 Tax=Brevibacterium yomogidense TaxID=946573 RepID=A0A1X6X242_9MICO|nr:TetR family transcriptional regulator [Brevibacterium yomogidense]SLM92510.1 Transcriptional regulator, TetR family [Brevibacterium yomogidense]